MNLNKSLTAITAVSFFMFVALAETNQNQNASQSFEVQASELVTQIDQQLHSPLKEFFEMSQIMSTVQAAPSFSALVTLTLNKWENILDNWDSIVTNDNTRLIQIHALMFLPPEDYLKCLERMLDLYKKGLISSHEYGVMLFSAENDKQWFLAYNYKAPEVVAFLDKLEETFKGVQYMQSIIKSVRSGKRKAREEYFRNRKTKLFRDKYPVPMLPSMIKYEKSLFGQIETRKTTLLIGLIVLSIAGVFIYRKNRRKA